MTIEVTRTWFLNQEVAWLVSLLIAGVKESNCVSVKAHGMPNLNSPLKKSTQKFNSQIQHPNHVIHIYSFIAQISFSPNLLLCIQVKESRIKDTP